MVIDPSDVVSLSDAELKRLAISADREAERCSTHGAFWRAFSRALVVAERERRACFVAFELDVLDDQEVGAIVGLGSDPVGEAIALLKSPRPGAGTVEWEEP